MKVLKLTCFCLIFATVNVTAEIITGVAVATSVTLALYGSYNYIRCKAVECCDDNWVTTNITALKSSIHTKLYGQHLVRDVVLSSVRSHTSQDEPPKPLVLSFHGWTGGGKNYVSRMMAESLFQQGLESNFVHLYIAPVHFPHEQDVNSYKSLLQNWIIGNMSLCRQSLFIFDEVDKMPSGILDAVTPMMDGYKIIDGVKFNKATFILLSNTAGDAISKYTYENWRAGKRREDIKLKEMEEIITTAAFNEKGGLWHSQLITKNVISALVPFLPLEISHIKSCIKDDIRSKGYDIKINDALLNEIANELQYYPADEQLFSKSGCKRVSEKVDYVLEVKGLL